MTSLNEIKLITKNVKVSMASLGNFEMKEDKWHRLKKLT